MIRYCLDKFELVSKDVLDYEHLVLVPDYGIALINKGKVTFINEKGEASTSFIHEAREKHPDRTFVYNKEGISLPFGNLIIGQRCGYCYMPGGAYVQFSYYESPDKVIGAQCTHASTIVATTSCYHINNMRAYDESYEDDALLCRHFFMPCNQEPYQIEFSRYQKIKYHYPIADNKDEPELKEKELLENRDRVQHGPLVVWSNGFFYHKDFVAPVKFACHRKRLDHTKAIYWCDDFNHINFLLIESGEWRRVLIPEEVLLENMVLDGSWLGTSLLPARETDGDVSLLCDDGTRVKAHALVLKHQGGDFFNALLFNGMGETIKRTKFDQTLEPIEIKNIDGKTLNLVMEYIYLGTFDLKEYSITDVVKLYIALDRFNLERGKGILSRIRHSELNAELTDEDLDYLDQIIDNLDRMIAARCLEFITACYKDDDEDGGSLLDDLRENYKNVWNMLSQFISL